MLNGNVGDLVFPPLSGVCPFEEKLLVRLLRHHRSGRANSAVGTAIICARQSVGRWICTQNQNFKISRSRSNTFNFDGDRRIKSPESLRQLLERLVSDHLAYNRAIWRNTNEYHSAPTIHESAKGLSRPRKLGGALLEFKLIGLAAPDEFQEFLLRHIVMILQQQHTSNSLVGGT